VPEPLDAGTALSLFTAGFFVPFLWLFLVVVFAALFDDVEGFCAAALAGEAAVWAAKVNGTAAAVKASARIVFFIVFISRRAVLFIARSHFHLAGICRIKR
jgi:hypothetical protein